MYEAYFDDVTAGRFLGVSPYTIRRWRLNGTLGFRRIGPRRVAISAEDIAALLSKREQRA